MDAQHICIISYNMPCFFFISGWLLNERYIDNPKIGIVKKAKGIYVPYVKWTLFFILLHNVFTRMHIYDSSYSLLIFWKRIIHAITMTDSEQPLGGYWFLISLFWASVVTILLFSLLKKHNMLTHVNIWRGIIIFLFLSIIFKHLPFKLYQYYSEQTILAIVFYMSGYYMKKRFGVINKSIFGIILFIPLIIIAFFWHTGMAGPQGSKGFMILPYFILAIFGTIALITLSTYIRNWKICKLFTYIGDKTLYILTFHFLAFKTVSFFYLYINELSIEQLAEFPTLSNASVGMSFIYTLVGVIFPLSLWEFLDKLKNRFFNSVKHARNKKII